MPRDSELYLRDILEAIEHIEANVDVTLDCEYTPIES